MEETTQKHIGGSTFAHSPTSSATSMQISNLQTRTQTRGIMYTKLRVPRGKMERKMRAPKEVRIKNRVNFTDAHADI